jgi:hypothetical protein
VEIILPKKNKNKNANKCDGTYMEHKDHFRTGSSTSTPLHNGKKLWQDLSLKSHY